MSSIDNIPILYAFDKMKKISKFLKKNWIQIILLFSLLLTIAALSYLRWKRDHEVFHGEYCPDGYCVYAEKIANFLKARDHESYLNLEKYCQKSTIAISPLAPLFTAVLSLIFADITTSYQIVSFIFSIATIAIFLNFLRRFLKFKGTGITIPTILLSSHIIFIRSFARPLTDSIGLAFTLASIYLILDISDKFSYKKLFYYSLFILVSLFARVSVFPIIGFMFIWYLFKFMKSKSKKFLELIFVQCMLVTACFALINIAFGTFHTVFKALDTAHNPRFLLSYNTFDLVKVLVVSLQLYPLIWIYGVSKKEFLKSKAEQINFFWIIFYLLFLVIGKGALWNRYLLPIVPSLILVSARPIMHLQRNRKTIGISLIGLVVLFSLIPLITQIIDPQSYYFQFIIGYFH